MDRSIIYNRYLVVNKIGELNWYYSISLFAYGYILCSSNAHSLYGELII